jgi:hypothetical protein
MFINKTKAKIILSAVITIVILNYIIGLSGKPFLFIVFLPIISLILLSLLSFFGFFLIEYLIWRLAPHRITENFLKRKLQFRIILLVCLVFFFIGISMINRFGLIGISGLVDLLGYGGVFAFSVFLGWGLIVPNKKKVLRIGLILFPLIFLPIFFILNYHKHIELTPSGEVLKSLPYPTWVPDLAWVPAEDTIQKSGVILYDKKLSFQGLNLYNSRDLTTAYLMDMSGNIVHSWTSRIGEHDGWHHIELLKNNDLLAIVKDKTLVKLNSSSKVKFNVAGRFHHDVAIAENQDIYTLVRKDDLVFHCGLPLPILNECIVIVSPQGKIKREIRLYKIVNKKFHFGLSASSKKMLSIYGYILNVKNYKEILTRRQRGHFIFDEDSPFDIFHANSIEIIDRNIDGLCKKGDLLISIRQLNLIAVLDIKKEEIIWSWGPGKLLRQHHPTLLENGNILVFNNRSFTKRRYSRVVELNPLTRLIVWEYKSHPPQRFFSPSRGGSQRLPNGNTLITNSDSGQVFEVTRDGEVVWEFYNPRIKEKSKKRAVIYRMMRIVDPENYPWLRDLK